MIVTAAIRRPMTDYDSPWKEAWKSISAPSFALLSGDPCRHRLVARLCLFGQGAAKNRTASRRRAGFTSISWSRVWRKNGDEAWVLIHIEVQTQPDAEFPKRMFGYNTRIFAVYNRTVVSLAILADDDPDWRRIITRMNYGAGRSA